MIFPLTGGPPMLFAPSWLSSTNSTEAEKLEAKLALWIMPRSRTTTGSYKYKPSYNYRVASYRLSVMCRCMCEYTAVSV